MTRKTFRAACVQMCSGRDINKNLETVRDFAKKAKAEGAQYVQTPEVTTLMERDKKRLFSIVEEPQKNQCLAFFSDLAKELGLWLHIGSMAVKLSDNKLANRAYLFNPDGQVVQWYDKIHMFDVELANGERYRESSSYQSGDRIVTANLPWGKLGLSICYDLRFPHLYSDLKKKGAEILTIPSAFTRPTGAAHWHILMRARAIENYAYVIAAAQTGSHENGRETFGHSLIIDPQGAILQEADDECGIIVSDIDLESQQHHNVVLPRRPDTA